MVFDQRNSAFEQAKAELSRAAHPRAGEKVCIGTPHLDKAGWNYTESLIRMCAYDKQHGNHLLHNSGLMNNGAFTPVWGRGIELAHARNSAAAAFLSSEADWHLWIDSDMGFEPDSLEKLLDAADPVTAPIIGALCFIEQEYSHDFRGGLRSSLAPTLYDWSWVEPKNGMPGAYQLTTRTDWPNGQVTRVGATGTGMLLVHRSAYEKISAWLQEEGAPPSIWFERIPGPAGDLCGEDVSFCLRAHQVNLPVLVHTGVTTSHQKTVWYGHEDYASKPFTPPPSNILPLPPDQWPKLAINPAAAKQAAETSPIREKQVPEADEHVAVIVPVAKRNNAKAFLTSLHDSLTVGQRDRVTVYVMADATDQETVNAWTEARNLYPATWIFAKKYAEPMGTFAEKVNEGYRVGDPKPWLFIVGDDVKFHAGWLDQAMETAHATGKHVIGTNDLGNPSVTSGNHATHMFIRREYVDKTGASWDGPGVVCHEGYRHWFVDNELIAAAKQVGAWAPCLLSHVEHMHPLWKKGPDDEVYRIGQEAAEADRERWWARQQIHGDALVMVSADGFPRRVAHPSKIENEGE